MVARRHIDAVPREALRALRDCTDPKCSLCAACCQTIWTVLGDFRDRPVTEVKANDLVRRYRRARR